MKLAITALLALPLWEPACSKASPSAAPAGDAAPSAESAQPAALSEGAHADAPPFEAGPPPFDAQAGDAGAVAAAGASQRAEDCLASPTCPAADAARLFVAASDANDPDVDCFRFVDGMGTARNVMRARACFEHQENAHACGGGSPDLQAAELAMMQIDGVGGRANIPAARALLAGCFDDATLSGILEHAAKKERDPKTPSVDFCKDIGGTTITMNECMARESQNADTQRELEAKVVVAGLDSTGQRLFAASEKAYAEYVSAMGTFVYEVYVQGTIRGAMSIGEEHALKVAHAKDLAEFPRFVAKETSDRDVESAQRAAASALAKAVAGTTTPAEKEALQKTQRTWTAYRDAEVGLYEYVFGPKQGANRVHAALLLRLESRRAKECAPPSAGPE
jgi:hypothetical protein